MEKMADIDRYRDKDRRKAQIQQNAIKYTKEHYKQFAFRLRNDADADIIEMLEGIKSSDISLNQYIVGLIRADMESKK